MTELNLELPQVGLDRMPDFVPDFVPDLEPIRKPGICERLIGSEFWSQRADVLHRDRPQIPTAR